MKAIKFMISGGLLILLGPVMATMDIWFSEFMLFCWILGVPLFLVGLFMPADGDVKVEPSDDLPQKTCPSCGKTHDFDYPACPHCGHDYQAKPVR